MLEAVAVFARYATRWEIVRCKVHTTKPGSVIL